MIRAWLRGINVFLPRDYSSLGNKWSCKIQSVFCSRPIMGQNDGYDHETKGRISSSTLYNTVGIKTKFPFIYQAWSIYLETTNHVACKSRTKKWCSIIECGTGGFLNVYDFPCNMLLLKSAGLLANTYQNRYYIPKTFVLKHKKLFDLLKQRKLLLFPKPSSFV